MDFDPDIIVGPKVLEFLRDYFMRHNSSIDVILYSKSTVIAAIVNDARERFQGKAMDVRLGFGVMMRVQTELRKHGHTGLQWSPDADKDGGLCDAMMDLLRGRLVRDVKLLRTLTK